MNINTYKIVPISVLLFSFLLILYSINGIIKMTTMAPINNTKFNEALELINKQIYSNSKVSSQAIESIQGKLPNNLSLSFPHMTRYEALNKLPSSEQNTLVKSELLDLKARLISDQLNQQYQSQKPLIFRFGFWVYGFLIWVGSIVGGDILKFWTNEFINKYLKKA